MYVGNKNMQLVLQCYSRMEAVLHILPHTFKPVLQQISLLQAWNKICIN